jgi:hypothetical protein
VSHLTASSASSPWLYRLCMDADANLVIRYGNPILNLSTLAEQSGRFALACQAHVQTLSPNIDEPEHRAALLSDLKLTCTHA